MWESFWPCLNHLETNAKTKTEHPKKKTVHNGVKRDVLLDDSEKNIVFKKNGLTPEQQPSYGTKIPIPLSLVRKEMKLSLSNH